MLEIKNEIDITRRNTKQTIPSKIDQTGTIFMEKVKISSSYYKYVNILSSIQLNGIILVHGANQNINNIFSYIVK